MASGEDFFGVREYERGAVGPKLFFHPRKGVACLHADRGGNVARSRVGVGQTQRAWLLVFDLPDAAQIDGQTIANPTLSFLDFVVELALFGLGQARREISDQDLEG
ncbi:MAG: hypothetical protein QM784_10040 [Polyangiaceae bacterium]